MEESIMFLCFLSFFRFLSFFLFISYFGYYLLCHSIGLYSNLSHSNEQDVKEDAKPMQKYEDKYMDRFDKLESVPLSVERLDALKNAILMETTPLGNVIMYWDQNKEGFTYYSDATIPYRYLEVIARKYVVVNQCKSLYIDMREELKDAEQRRDEKKRLLTANVGTIVSNKKSVFAKLKQYNHVVDPKKVVNKSAAASKVPINSNEKEKEKEASMLVKERANIYSREGKVNQFSFLKKVKRECVDKRMALSFADFKRGIKIQ